MFIPTTLSGFPCMVPVARVAVSNALLGCPRRGDAVQVVSEFATNAVRHSHSRGGQFEVGLEIKPGRLRVEVRDGGPFGYPPRKPEDAPVSRLYPWIALFEEDHQRDRGAEIEEYRLSLAVINAFCDEWGTSRYKDYALWWAKFAWPHPAATAPARESDRALTAGGPEAETTDDPPTGSDVVLFLADPVPGGRGVVLVPRSRGRRRAGPSNSPSSV